MPRFVADPTKATAGFIVFPKGIYRVEFGEPKSFAGKGKKGENHGVRYPSKVIACEEHPELVGKIFMQNLYLHTEGAANFSKQIEVAVLGAKDDADFNARFGSEDWSYNTDDASVGQGFWLLKGQAVDIECGEPQINEETGDLQTKVVRYRSVK